MKIKGKSGGVNLLRVAFIAMAIVWCFSGMAAAQGLSFSYLLPKNGYLSAPVSPLSIRGVGYYYGAVGVETGGSVYAMAGLGMEGLPFEAAVPLTGPHFSMLVPVELAFKLDTKIVTWKIKGGAAGIWHVNPRLNLGNFDRALRTYEGWQVANADMDISAKPGLGWIAGTGFEWHVARDFSISTDVSYLRVTSKANLTGSYTGGNTGALETRVADFPDALINLEGLEISLGVTLRR